MTDLSTFGLTESIPPPVQKEWNPRYVAYAKVHGKTPEEMAVQEKNNHSRFIAWIGEKWRNFDNLYPEFQGCHADEAQSTFDQLLAKGGI